MRMHDGKERESKGSERVRTEDSFEVMTSTIEKSGVSSTSSWHVLRV